MKTPPIPVAIGQVWRSAHQGEETITIVGVDDPAQGPYPVEFVWNDTRRTEGRWDIDMHDFVPTAETLAQLLAAAREEGRIAGMREARNDVLTEAGYQHIDARTVTKLLRLVDERLQENRIESLAKPAGQEG